MDKPISPRGHALLDYSLAATLLTAPPLMGLSRRARTVFGALGLNAAAVNALTAQPLAVKPLIPLSGGCGSFSQPSAPAGAGSSPGAGQKRPR